MGSVCVMCAYRYAVVSAIYESYNDSISVLGFHQFRTAITPE